jgi:hypothetical protein
MPRRGVVTGAATALAPVVVAVAVNLLTTLVPFTWVYAWRWPLTVVLGLLVLVPVLWAARHKQHDRVGLRAVTTASDVPGAMDVAVVSGPDRVLISSYRETGEWSAWTDLRLPAQAWDVTLVSPRNKVLECFVVDRSGDMWMAIRDRDSWSPWQRFPRVPKQGKPIRLASASLKAGHQEVYCVTDTGRLLHSWKWDEHSWSSWYDSELPRCVDVAFCSPKDGLLECFAADRDGDVWHRWFWDGEWSEWEMWGRPGSAATAVSAFRKASDHQEMFVVGASGDLGHRWHRSGGPWSAWAAMSTPAALVDVAGGTTSAHRLHCLVLDVHGNLWHREWDNEAGRWLDWRDTRPVADPALV